MKVLVPFLIGISAGFLVDFLIGGHPFWLGGVVAGFVFFLAFYIITHGELR